MNDLLGGRWRRIYSNEWHAAAFQGLTDAERNVYFYARTGPQSTSIGIYRMSTAVAVEEMGNLTAIEFDARLDTVCQAFGWRFDPPTRVLWLRAWLDENPPQSPNVVTNWVRLLGTLPASALKFEAVDAMGNYLKDMKPSFREPFESYRQRLSKEGSFVKPSALSQALSHQGSEIRDPRSGEQRTGARRAEAHTKSKKSPNPTTSLTPDARVVTIARATIRQNPTGSVESWLDCIQDTALHSNIQANRQAAVVALAAARDAAGDGMLRVREMSGG